MEKGLKIIEKTSMFSCMTWIIGLFGSIIVTALGCGWENMQHEPLWLVLYWINIVLMFVGMVSMIIVGLLSNKYI